MCIRFTSLLKERCNRCKLPSFQKTSRFFTALIKINKPKFCPAFQNRSVQLVARNRECLKALNNVPYVIWSCIKMHATHEIVNYASRLIIRATSCTLRFWKARRNFGSLILISAVKDQAVFGRKAICNDYSVPLTKKWNACTFNLTGNIGSTWWKVIHKNNHRNGNKNGRHIDLPFFISAVELN